MKVIPKIFISYSDSDPLSRLCCSVVHQVGKKLNFSVERYKNEDRQQQWPNYDASSVEASLQAAQWADVVIAIVIRTYCGWIPRAAAAGGTLKSICRMEYEAGQLAGRHVIAVVIATEFSEILKKAVSEAANEDSKEAANIFCAGEDPKDVRIAFLESKDQWTSAQVSQPNPVEQTALSEFISFLTDQPNTVFFPSLTTLQDLLEKNLRKWKRSRRLLERFPAVPNPTLDRQSLVESLSRRMCRPGVIAVTGAWGVGATTVAIQAARRAANYRLPNMILYQSCLGKEFGVSCEELCRQASLNSDDLNRLGIHRNLIILDHPTEQMCRDLPAETATWVLVTSDQRMLKNIGITDDKLFSVQLLTFEGAQEFLDQKLPVHCAREPNASKELLQLLPGWPLALDAITDLINDDMGPQPIATCVRQLQSGDYAVINRRLLDRLTSEALRNVVLLAALPHAEFRTFIASLVLCKEQTEVIVILNELASQRILVSIGDQHWRMEEAFRGILNSSVNWQDERRSANQRLGDGLRDILNSDFVDATVNEELQSNFQLVLDVVLPGLSDVTKSGIRRLIDFARRIRAWGALEQLCTAVSDSSNVVKTKEDTAFYLWTAGKAAARRQSLDSATRLFLRAVKLVESNDSPLVAQILTSLGSNLANRGQHEEAVKVFQRAIDLEERFPEARHRRYIIKHTLAKSLWYLQQNDQATKLLDSSLSDAKSVSDHEHLANAYLTRSLFLTGKSSYEETIQCFDQALEAASRIRSESTQAFQRCLILERRGDFLLRNHDPRRAQASLEEASRFICALNEPDLDLKIHLSLLAAYQQLGVQANDSVGVQEYLRRERTLDRRLRVLLPVLRQANNSANAEAAERLFLEFSSIDRGQLSAFQSSVYLIQLGELQRRRGERIEAIKSFELAIEQSKSANNERGVTIGILQLAKTLRECRRFDDAIKHLTSRYNSPKCDQIGKARISNLLGQLYIDLRDYDGADKALDDSLAIESALGGAVCRSQAYPLHALGEVCFRKRRYHQAISRFKEALNLERRFENSKGQMIVLHSLSRAELGSGDIAAAETHLQESLRIAERLSSDVQKCQLLRTLSRVLESKGEHSSAEGKLKLSVQVADESQEPHLLRHRVLVRCELAARRIGNDKSEAIRLYSEALRLAQDHRELELELVVTARFATLQSIENASELLESIIRRSLSMREPLGSARALIPVLKQLVAALRQAGEEARLERLLSDVLGFVRRLRSDTTSLSRMSRVRCLVVSELGRLMVRQARNIGSTAALEHYQRECEAAMSDGDTSSAVRILGQWCEVVASRGDVDNAANTIVRYIVRLKEKGASASLIYRLYLMRAEWLATRSKRLRSTADSEEWKMARRACLESIRWSAATNLKSRHQARMILASLLLDIGRVKLAQVLLRDWFEMARRLEDWSSLEAENASGEEPSVHMLDTIYVWARINQREAIEMIDRLINGPSELNAKWDFVELSCLKSRLLREQRPYSAEKAIQEAYDKACEKKDLEAQARLATAHGRLLQRLQQNCAAKERFVRAVEVRQQLGDPLATFDALRVLSLHLRHQMEQQGEALIIAQQAMKELDHVLSRRLILARNSLVKLHREMGELTLAEREANVAISEARRWGEPRLEGAAHLTFAAVLADSERSREAIAEYGKVIAILEHDPGCNAFRYALRARGQLLYRTRSIDGAILDCRRFLKLSDSICFPESEVIEMRCQFARILRQCGVLDAALSVIESAIHTLPEVANRYAFVGVINGLSREEHQHLQQMMNVERALVLIGMNRYGEACWELEKLVQECQQSKTDETCAQAEQLLIVSRSLAKAHACLGHRSAALEWLRKSEPEHTAIHRNLAIWELDCAIVFQRLGEFDQAVTHITSALKHSENIRDYWLKLSTKASVLGRGASIELMRFSIVDAERYARESLNLAREVGSLTLQSKAADVLTRVQLAKKAPIEALQTIAEARQWIETLQAAVGPESSATKIRATFIGLEVEANRALNENERADQLDEELGSLVDLLNKKGFILQPYEIGQSDRYTLVKESLVQQRSAAKEESDDLQVSGVVSLVRDGSPSGVVVKLIDGREGFCSVVDAFAGFDGNLHRRYVSGQEAKFRILSDSSCYAGEEMRVALAAIPECELAEGRTVAAKMLDDSRTGDGEFVTVELESGERIPIKFPTNVGWIDPSVGDLAKRMQAAGISNESPEVFVRILRTESDSKLTASLKIPYERFLRTAASRRIPMPGEIVACGEYGIAVRVAPGVVGLCKTANAVTSDGQEKYLKPGDRIAVVVDRVDGDSLILNRVVALEYLLKQESRRQLKATVIFSDRAKGTLLKFGPGLVGMGETPTRPFAPNREVEVQVAPKLNSRGGVTWHTIKSGRFEGIVLEENLPNLMTLLREELKTTPAETQSDSTQSDSSYDPIPLEYRGKTLQPFQRDAMRAIAHRDNIILCAPTGAGKTLVADWAIEQSLKQGRRAIFASPVKALSNQKFRDFRRFETYAGQVGMITGDVKVNPLAPVLVVTTETFRNWVIDRPESLKYFDIAIFDEVHYLDDDNRGSAWEESMIYAPPEMQIIALSATIPNVATLSRWMHSARKCPASVIPATPIPRPVPLRHQICSISRKFEVLSQLSDVRPWFFQPEDSENIRTWRYDDEEGPAREIVDFLKKNDRLPAIYFCSERNDCEAYATEAASRISLLDDLESQKAVDSFDQLLNAQKFPESTTRDHLRSLVQCGISFHHSGQLPVVKMTIEELFENGHIRLLYATDTFAIGVNMPAKSVVFDSLCRGHKKWARRLSGRQYAQMAGRAGRFGKEKDEYGTAYSLIGRKQVRASDFAKYEKGVVEAITSHLAPSYRTMCTLFGKRKETIDGFWVRTLACAEANGGRDDSRYRSLCSRWAFLERIGYRAHNELTRQGLLCAKLAMHNEVSLTEAWSNGWLIELDPVQIVVFFGCLACDKNLSASKGEVEVISRQWWERLENRIKELRRLEIEVGLQHCDQILLPRRGVEKLFSSWAQGESLWSALTQTVPSASPGDFISWARMAIQGLTSIVAALPADDPCIPRLIEALTLLDRDEVRWNLPGIVEY